MSGERERESWDYSGVRTCLYVLSVCLQLFGVLISLISSYVKPPNFIDSNRILRKHKWIIWAKANRIANEIYEIKMEGYEKMWLSEKHVHAKKKHNNNSNTFQLVHFPRVRGEVCWTWPGN